MMLELYVCFNKIYVGMVSVTSASRYQSRSLMYIQGLIPRNSTELAEAVPIAWHDGRLLETFANMR